MLTWRAYDPLHGRMFYTPDAASRFHTASTQRGPTIHVVHSSRGKQEPEGEVWTAKAPDRQKLVIPRPLYELTRDHLDQARPT